MLGVLREEHDGRSCPPFISKCILPFCVRGESDCAVRGLYTPTPFRLTHFDVGTLGKKIWSVQRDYDYHHFQRRAVKVMKTSTTQLTSSCAQGYLSLSSVSTEDEMQIKKRGVYVYQCRICVSTMDETGYLMQSAPTISVSPHIEGNEGVCRYAV